MSLLFVLFPSLIGLRKTSPWRRETRVYYTFPSLIGLRKTRSRLRVWTRIHRVSIPHRIEKNTEGCTKICPKERVSIPHRIEKNWYPAESSEAVRQVSIPHRIEKNQHRGHHPSSIGTVSIPHRIEKNFSPNGIITMHPLFPSLIGLRKTRSLSWKMRRYSRVSIPHRIEKNRLAKVGMLSDCAVSIPHRIEKNTVFVIRFPLTSKCFHPS